MSIEEATRGFNFRGLREAPSIEDSKLKQIAERVAEQLYFTELREPNTRTVLDIYQVLLSHYSERGSLMELPVRYIAQSPWAILVAMEERKPELASLPTFLDQYFALLRTRKSRTVLPALLHVYLFYYPIEKAYAESLRTNLLALFAQGSSHRVTKLRQFVDQQGLLAKPGHLKLVRDFKTQTPLADTLTRYRLTGGLEKSHFTEVGLRQYLQEVGQQLINLPERAQLVRINELLSLLSGNGALTFPRLRVSLADALLGSFYRRPISETVQERLKRFFTQVYGDPRLDRSRWAGVSERSIDVLRQWLVEDTLEDFFRLLSHVARHDSTSDRHWKYRKAFWKAYVRKGYISEAWVALGPEAMAAAPQFLGPNKSYYANLRASDRKHSALIMKIGELVITEWSHSGSYRVWHERHNPPQLYRSEYSREKLIQSPDLEDAHRNSDTGGWQQKLATFIFQQTGLKVTAGEYMYGV